MSNYLENVTIDAVFRGQPFPSIANLYFALFTTAPTAAGGGVEVSGGAYARVAVAASLANFAGTQGATSTTASTGTSGQTSNNTKLSFPTPTAAWGTVVAMGIFDAATGGNELFYGPLASSQVVGIGNAVYYDPAQMTLTLS
ncbi:MAG: hypothetical protein B7Z80_12620 [Rhodospirillales bacterium 20-64-7]|nr:MAG: hypothetical protein B7Z80_12620 [Rhodospirillales bacterium 20-64-7]